MKNIASQSVIYCLSMMAMCMALSGQAKDNSSQPSGDPILVGLIAGTTGAYGSTGVATVRGAKLAIEKINNNGGVLGRPFKLSWHNDNASATLASQLFKKLRSQGAVAIDGSPDTGPIIAKLADRYQMLTIGVVDDGGLSVYPNGPDNKPYEWVFSTSLNTFAWGTKIGQYALSHCPAGLAVLHDPTGYGKGGLYGIKRAYSAAGKKVALADAVTENWSTGAAKNLTSEMEKIKKAGVTCVDVWLTPQNQAAFAKSAKTHGYDFKLLGNDESNADDTYSKLAGKAADGTVSAVLTATLNPTAEYKSFEKKYKKKFDAEVTPFAGASYDSILMLAKAIEKTKSTKSSVLKDAFNHINHFDGITGKDLSFSPQKHVTINAEELTLVQYDASKKRWIPINAKQ